ncbi:MAG TPA: zinc-binding dehydrogenase [Miltoncostaeaceae bacterium]|nr:zinc-binding dehydrogenase [Miltoncostaeaceae bacterium]
MDAIILSGTGGPDVLRLGTAPDPTAGPGQVVVQIRAAAVNHRDVFLRRGIAPSPLPVIIGSDGVGVVRELGAGVSGVAPGDEVVILPSLGWGIDQAAPAPTFRILGGPDDGTHAELIAVPGENVFPKPAGYSWEEAAALPLAGLTAWRALFSRARLLPGETVLVLGIGGGVATFALHLAHAAGARVIVTSSSDEKLARAARMGAQGGVNYRNEADWPRAVRELTGGRGVDVVVDSIGSTWAKRVASLAPGGRLVAFGGTGGAPDALALRAVTFGQVSLLGTTMGSPADFAELLAAAAVHPWRPVIDSVRPLAETAAAHARIDAGENFGKLVLSVR